MRRLHALIHYGQQTRGQAFQLNVVAQAGAEGGQGLPRVVRAAIKAPVNGALHPAQNSSAVAQNDSAAAPMEYEEAVLDRLRELGYIE